MDKIFSIISIKAIWNYILMAVLAAVTPTQNFVLVVCIACMFNLFGGMRADGVTNIRCKNFSWRKFRYCLAELLVFLLIIEVVAILFHIMGDRGAQYYVCKTLAYCIAYFYVDNGLKNICKAYPKSKGMWIVYLFIHLDFKRVLKIDELIEKYDAHLKKQENGTYRYEE